MTRLSAGVVVATGVVILGGCATPLERPQAVRIGQTQALATPADVRMIVERDPPSVGSRVICAEPSPDISKALSTLQQISGAAQVPNGPQANMAAGASTAEAVAALAGRTASVVALRDGLFRACEAYANGTLGRRGYGLILSQYGDLLVTLMLGEAASATSRSGAAISVASPSAPVFTSAPGTPASSSSTGNTSGHAPASAALIPADSAPKVLVTDPRAMRVESAAPGAAGQALTTEGGAAAAVAEIAAFYNADSDHRDFAALLTVCVQYNEPPPGAKIEPSAFMNGLCSRVLSMLDRRVAVAPPAATSRAPSAAPASSKPWNPRLAVSSGR